ncbi:MAG: hypothetical protein H7Y36_04190 [Armatimonadetes bacterium]|nr:hypothetical protein [Akkermansiaceae bacterium]
MKLKTQAPQTFAFFPLVILCATSTLRADVIYTDNFDVADTDLDGSDQTGRHTGLIAQDVLIRSGGIQSLIVGNKLNFRTTGEHGSLRFQPSSLPADTLYDFASGASGAKILAEQRFRIEFDWTPPDTSGGQWISVNIGNTTFDSLFQVVSGDTDYGILFKNKGEVEIFDSGAQVSGLYSYTVNETPTTRHAAIDFQLSSFADGSNVTANAYVDGISVGAPVVFQLAGNNGVLNIQFGNNQPGAAGGFMFDNLLITTDPMTSPLLIKSVSRDAVIGFTINFQGAPNTSYKVTKSNNLQNPFQPLTIPLTVMTNSLGEAQAVVPPSEASEASEFYRIESL